LNRCGHVVGINTARAIAVQDLETGTIQMGEGIGFASHISELVLLICRSKPFLPTLSEDRKDFVLNRTFDQSPVDAKAKEVKRWILAGFAEDGRVQRMEITLADLLSASDGLVHFGRNPSRCSLVITDMTVSGVHGKFRARDGNLEVSDSGSTNGTWVNQQPVTPHAWVRLVNGDHLLIGGTELRVFHH
jgi:hypothetical protein